MFGIDGIEFLIILIVMIVIVGPKDLPKMMRAFGQATTKMRKTAMEFRRHFDEAMREAELDELSGAFKQVQKLDPRKNLTEIFDPLREVTSDIKASLVEPPDPPSSTATPLEEPVLERFPKSVERFSDKRHDENKDLERLTESSEMKTALAKKSNRRLKKQAADKQMVEKQVIKKS